MDSLEENAYDQVAKAAGVDRETAKKVLLAAGYIHYPSTVLGHMHRMVERFNREVIGLPIPEKPTVLSAERLKQVVEHLHEELAEFEDATRSGDVAEAVDGMIDFAYICLGRLVEMGFVGVAGFEGVHSANMAKVRGVKASRPTNTQDSVKPEGWLPFDLEPLLRIGKADAELFLDMSPVLVEVAKLRHAKGKDYNTGIELTDYFPFGHPSYAHIVYQKSLRVLSLVKLIMAGRTPNFEGLRDTLLDVVNYCTFYVEWLDAGAKAKVDLSAGGK